MQVINLSLGSPTPVQSFRDAIIRANNAGATVVAALVISRPVGGSDDNGNGRWDAAEVKNKLKSSASDLGQPGPDANFGAGLVNAARAVQ